MKRENKGFKKPDSQSPKYQPDDSPPPKYQGDVKQITLQMIKERDDDNIIRFTAEIGEIWGDEWFKYFAYDICNSLNKSDLAWIKHQEKRCQHKTKKLLAPQVQSLWQAEVEETINRNIRRGFIKIVGFDERGVQVATTLAGEKWLDSLLKSQELGDNTI